MIKVIIIVALLAILIFSIVRKLKIFGSLGESSRLNASTETIEIVAPLSLYKSLVQKTLFTVAIGIGLLLITIILASKFKIALIMLPISIYLIAQFFILNNHIKIAKSQHLSYNINSHNLSVQSENNKILNINILNDIKSLQEVKAVQKNNGILFGYYKIITVTNEVVYIPFLISENLQTKPFFEKLQLFNREIETKLFPVI
ncbi:hypothetical protein EDC17_10756 [Sphingobacterium alimentarium]|uniref:Uncharacterized protein n=1 Tax=Sphingobacterium alimentarium TaxID=797292 RepID=A0A4R3VMR1_9SPHI|nr:hypothetical protein [Sphingobacterium alimentarium]TCV05355.1 hypothetical protein EDC17_10756 [Sphingobacterium alimentarium]